MVQYTVSLTDLKRRQKEVDLGEGQAVMVKAISVAGLTSIMGLIPMVRHLIGNSLSSEEITAEKLLSEAPDLVAALICAGMDKADDPAELAAAKSLDIGTQAALLQGVVEASMPRGIGPFMESMASVVQALGLVGGGRAPATKSRKG